MLQCEGRAERAGERQENGHSGQRMVFGGCESWGGIWKNSAKMTGDVERGQVTQGLECMLKSDRKLLKAFKY